MAIYKTIGGGFPPPVDVSMNEALERMRAQAMDFARRTVGLLKEKTPIGSGAEESPGHLRSTATYWGLRIYGRGGFAFRLGWRKQDFIGMRAFYAPYVNWGTGTYYGSGGRIFPKKAKKLVWEGGDGKVVMESTKGQRGQHMIEDTTKEAIELIMKLIPGAVAHGFKTVMD